MPTPTVAPPPKTRELPANLDELVRRAMTGGGLGALKQALETTSPGGGPGAPPGARAGAGPAPIPAAPSADRESALSPPPTTEVLPASVAAEADPDPVVPPVQPPAGDPWDALVDAAWRGRALKGDPAAAALALAQIRAALDLLAAEGPPTGESRAAVALPGPGELAVGAGSESDPPPPDTGPPVRLPPARHAVALAMAAVPAGLEVGRLAAALEVDLATARAAALAGGARIVLRGADRDELDRRARALEGLGIRSRTLTRELLLDVGPATGLVGAEGAGVWRVVEASRWGENRPDPSQLPHGEVAQLADVWLVVQGEVEEKRLRAPAAESRWQRSHYAAPNGAGGEARIAVLDLHTDDGIVRVVEGATDLRHLPGVTAAGNRVALKALLEAVVLRWPAAHVEGKRTCPATARPGDPLRSDGWAAWEEHSRMCRALLR